MAELTDDLPTKMRRTLGLEIARMEDDFDDTRNQRKTISNKLVAAANTLNLVDPETGRISGEAEDGVKILNLALKSLSDTEKASATAISLKLRQNELNVASAAAAKERIQAVMEATRRGHINQTAYTAEALEDKLAEMFDSEIKDTEIKTNSDDLES